MVDIKIGLCSCCKNDNWLIREFMLSLCGWFCGRDNAIQLAKGCRAEFADVVLSHENLHYLFHKLGVALEENKGFDKLLGKNMMKTINSREEMLKYMDEAGVPR